MAWFGALIFLMLAPNALFAADPDYSNVPTANLIDELAGLDRSAPGIASMVSYEAFMAEDKPPKFAGGVLGVAPPESPPAMRELVRRGVDALPVLIQHLDDERPTKFVVGKDGPNFFFMFKLFGREYDSRKPLLPKDAEDMKWLSSRFFRNGNFDSYTVKIADVCYVLIGQIVNRKLVAVRYQPTAGLVVNSPLEEPTLSAQVKGDWDGLDARDHEESLVADVKIEGNGTRVDAALRRLRYYYPERYARLDGQDLLKRQEFEAEDAGYASQAYAYAQKNEHAKAVEVWTNWLKVAPQSARGYWKRGSEFAKSDRLDEAIEDLSRALELETKPYMLEVILRERSSAYHAKGADDQAMADYKELIKITSKDVGMYVRLGSFFDDQSQHELAIKLYNQALELNPKNARSYECRGIAYQRLGNTAKALDDFNKAVELDPKATDPHNAGCGH
jgi:tetratricopeptide (TPR) repeat protein